MDSLGTWLFSLGCLLGIPSLPLVIEAAKSAGEVKPESFYLTAAVLAASFGIASEQNWFRFGYIMAFLATIALDFQPSDPKLAWLGSGWAARSMIVVACLQSIERFTWHVVLDHKFPDWLKEA